MGSSGGSSGFEVCPCGGSTHSDISGGVQAAYAEGDGAAGSGRLLAVKPAGSRCVAECLGIRVEGSEVVFELA
jgi:hypothetical protein